MSNETRADIQMAESDAVAGGAEPTRSGPVFTPAVDIFETPEAITLLADMPGVGADDLTIDLRDSVLTLMGRVAAPGGEGETPVLREYRVGAFHRRFTLSERIDQARIDAQLRDGVLRLTLPKVERAKPRQITVRTT